jgi:hypothetical protein
MKIRRVDTARTNEPIKSMCSKGADVGLGRSAVRISQAS